jgi:sialic acid synthase SpsE
MRSIFTKSLAPRSDLSAGTVLAAEMLTLKKPGTGIAAEALQEVVGRRLSRAVAANRLLSWTDIEP